MPPPPLPTEQKKRRGTFRKDRSPGGASGVAPAAVERVPLDAPAPETLGEPGKAEWAHALKVCPWIAVSDLTALRMLCEAVDRRELLNAELTKTGASLMLETSTGYAYVNPAVAALEKTEERISKWMSVLGMTPSARGALGVAEVKQASTLDQLQARRAARAAGRPGTSPPSATPPSPPETARRSSSSSTPTGGSPRTASRARRELPSPRESGSDDSSETPSPETL